MGNMIQIIFAFTLFAKLIDIHIPSPSESQEMEKGNREKERDKNNETRQDPNASDEKKYEAIDALIKSKDAV
jgi:hypothetical protein